jgi:hypothetical protein
LTGDWAVFSVAFRKINSGTLNLPSGGTFQWDVKDKAGIPVARGLYYLRLEVKNPSGDIKKILKVLVL